MNDVFTKGFAAIGAFIALLVTTAMLGLLLAWPLMWTWNYVVPYLFDIKTISWGQAWCLSWVSGTLIKSHIYGK